VGPRAGVDAVWSREKYFAPAGNRTPAVEPVAIPTELSRLINPMLPKLDTQKHVALRYEM
jgi:hypothetical protein